MRISLTPNSVAKAFGVVVGVLVFAHAIVQVCRFGLGDDRFYGLVYLFSLGAEFNIPACYSAFALLVSSFLLAFTGYLLREAGRPMWMYWLGLSLIFLFMSADEFLGFHERLIEPVRAMLGTTGAFYYAWVIPYGIAVIGIGVVYLRFLVKLPRRTAIGFVVAGAMFVSGAIGMEMMGGIVFEQMGGSKNIPYVIVQSIEEILEMVSIVLFIYTIVDYMTGQFDSIIVTLEKET